LIEAVGSDKKPNGMLDLMPGQVPSTVSINPSQQKDSAAPLKPVADLWFENSGMVLIRAGTKEFHVPQCILTSQSRVFRELLKRDALSTKTSVVQLSEPPDYTEYFLCALFHSGFVFSRFLFLFLKVTSRLITFPQQVF